MDLPVPERKRGCDHLARFYPINQRQAIGLTKLETVQYTNSDNRSQTTDLGNYYAIAYPKSDCFEGHLKYLMPTRDLFAI